MSVSDQSDSRLRRAGIKLDAETMRRGLARGAEVVELLGVDPDEFTQMMKAGYNQAAAVRLREMNGDQVAAVKLVALDLFTYGVRLGMLLEAEGRRS